MFSKKIFVEKQLSLLSLQKTFYTNKDIIMNNEVTELPRRIVPNGLESENLGKFNTLYKNLLSSYVRLPLHLGEEALPKNPKEITEERLSSYIERMTKGLNEEQKNVWQQLYSDAVMQIKVIRQFFDSFPGAEFEVNDNISIPREQRINCINKVESIRSVSEIDVPEDCREYFDKIQNMTKALNEMRDYEKSHGLQHRPMDEMPFYATHADELAQLFIGGYFQKK